jgi:hypothetical protein
MGEDKAELIFDRFHIFTHAHLLTRLFPDYF